MTRPYIRTKPLKSEVYQQSYSCMKAFMDMLREAGPGGEVHGDTYYDFIIKRGIDPRIANRQCPALFKSFASIGYISCVKDKAHVSSRRGRKVQRVWKVTDKPLPKDSV